MPRYFFTIPNKTLVTYQVFSYSMILLNIAGLYLLNPQSQNFGQGFYLMLLLLTVLRMAWDYRNFKRQRGLMSNALLFVVLAFFWTRTEYTAGLWLNLLLAGLYFIAIRKLKIRVDAAGVSYPAFPPRNIAWEETGNLVLKDDILTIDLKNNKIYQHLIEYTDKPVNEQEFNDFCRARLEGSSR